MADYNCRLVEHNGYPITVGWSPIVAPDVERAAAVYCDAPEVWDRIAWSEGDEAIVEVEEFGGEKGVKRMTISAYSAIEFNAELADDPEEAV